MGVPPPSNLPVVSLVPTSRWLADLEPRAWVAPMPGPTSQAGDHGFLLGGTHHLALCAPQSPAQGWRGLYGRLSTPATTLQPLVPLGADKQLKAPVLSSRGGGPPGKATTAFPEPLKAMQPGAQGRRPQQAVIVITRRAPRLSTPITAPPNMR